MGVLDNMIDHCEICDSDWTPVDGVVCECGTHVCEQCASDVVVWVHSDDEQWAYLEY